jgi:hypothetical protein
VYPLHNYYLSSTRNTFSEPDRLLEFIINQKNLLTTFLQAGQLA